MELLWFSLCPMPLLLSLDTTEKNLVPSSWHSPLRYLETFVRSPLSLLQAKQAQLSQPVPIQGDAPVPSSPLSASASPCQPLSSSSLSLWNWGAQQLGTAPQMWPHQGRAEGEDHLPRPAGLNWQLVHWTEWFFVTLLCHKLSVVMWQLSVSQQHNVLLTF